MFFFSITQKKSLKSRRLDIWFISWMDGGDTIPHSEVKWYTNSYWQQDLQSLLMCIYIYTHSTYRYIYVISLCVTSIFCFTWPQYLGTWRIHICICIYRHINNTLCICVYIYICFYFILHAGCFLKIQCIMLKSNIQTARHVMYVFMYKHIYICIYIHIICMHIHTNKLYVA